MEFKNLTLNHFGSGHAGYMFELIESKSLRQRIESLNNGWDKEADDILQEISIVSSFQIILQPTYEKCEWLVAVRYWGVNKGKVNGSWSEWNTKEEYKEYPTSSCAKNKSFKNCLLWLLDKSGLEKPQVGDEVKADIEGKIYKVKILSQV